MSCEKGIFYLSSVTAVLIFVSYGTIVSWHSPVLPKFKSNDTNINPFGQPISTFEVSMSMSLFPAGSIFGNLIVSKLPDIFGRRKLLIYTTLICTASYFAMIFVDRFWSYCILLFIISTCLAASTVVVPTYLSEISEINNRGISSGALAVAKTVGQFYAYLVGPLTSFGVFSICCSVPLLLHLLFSFFTQESPIHLYLKGDPDGAVRALQKLRGSLKDRRADDEFKEKQKMVRTEEPKSAFNILFRTKAGRKAFFIALIVRFVPVTSGIFIVASFLGPLLSESGSSLSGHSLTMIVAFTKIIASIFCLFIIERIGRKVLILFGSFCCGSAMLGLAIYFYYKENLLEQPKNFGVLPIFCIFLYLISYTLGLGGTPYIIISELLPNEARATGTSIIFFICSVLLTLQGFTYPLIADYWGTYYGMLVFCVCCFGGFVLLLIFLPETRGKSFSQIQDILDGKSYEN